jgi:hypothetical protein
MASVFLIHRAEGRFTEDTELVDYKAECFACANADVPEPNVCAGIPRFMSGICRWRGLHRQQPRQFRAVAVTRSGIHMDE